LNKYFKLLAILSVSLLLVIPLFSNDKNNVDIAVLIEEAKKAPIEKRFELILQIKKTIANMNDENRAIAIAEVKTQRKAFRTENNMSNAQIEAFRRKIKAYEANASK
jgi:competence protein ComGC